MHKMTAYIERDPETGFFIGTVPGIPGAHTQAESLDELRVNLQEVIELCMEEMNSQELKEIPDFVGVQQIEVSL